MPMMNGTWFGLGGLAMVVFWIFVVAAVAWIVLALGRTQGQAPASGALRILEERLARGEIDAEEFRARRAAIEGTAR